MPFFSQTLTSDHEKAAPGDYATLVGSTYRSNAVVFALMMVRSLHFQEARFQFRQIRGGRPGNYFGTAALAPLENPQPNWTSRDLLAHMIQDADTAGNSYTVRQGPNLARLRPDWVTILLGSRNKRAEWVPGDPDTTVLGYIFKPGGPGSTADEILFPVEMVAHWAPYKDPFAQYRGMSWLTPVIREVMGDQAMTAHKLKFLEQGATVNMVVKYDTDNLELFERYKKLFREGHQGLQNAYKTLFIAKGADVTPVGTDLAQMDFRHVQSAGETRLAAAAGVPSILVGFSEGLSGSSLNAGNYCVPLDTEALTSTGWKHHDKLSVGDLVLGYDEAAEVTRWTPITKITEVFDADVVRFGNADWSVRCTDNHAWVGRWVKPQSTYPAWAASQTPTNWGRVETHQFREGFQLLTTAPAMTDQTIDVRPAEAAVLAWLFTDGSIERSELTGRTSQAGGAKVGIRGRIYQAHYRDELKSALALADAPYAEAPWKSSPGVWSYSLPAAWLRDLWKRAELDEISLSEFVLRLGPEARSAFLDAGMLAEGHDPGKSYPRRLGEFGDWYRWNFNQNDGPVYEAFALAAQLSGYSVRLDNGEAKCRWFRCAKPRLDGKHLKVTPAGREPVWCIETELGTWTMRQGRVITLTGNSTARRRFADGTIIPLWGGASDSLSAIVKVPANSVLACDPRDVAFMKDDEKDAAEIRQADASTIKSLIDAGYEADAIIDAVTSDDFSRLSGAHTGMTSVQLVPPNSNGSPNGLVNGKGTAGSPMALAQSGTQ